MKDLGYIEDRNLALEWRAASGKSSARARAVRRANGLIGVSLGGGNAARIIALAHGTSNTLARHLRAVPVGAAFFGWIGTVGVRSPGQVEELRKVSGECEASRWEWLGYCGRSGEETGGRDPRFD